MDFDWDEKKGDLSYKLLVGSILDTICFQFKDIKKVKLFFDGKEYRYIGDIGPIDDGLLPDWSILIR